MVTNRALGRPRKQSSVILPVYSKYMHPILNNLTLAEARYIAAGRGFRSRRPHFSILFSRTLLMLLYVALFCLASVLSLFNSPPELIQTLSSID